MQRLWGLLKRTLWVLVAFPLLSEYVGKILCVLLLPVPWSARLVSFSILDCVVPFSVRRRVNQNLEAVFGDTYSSGDRKRMSRRYLRLIFSYPVDFLFGLRMSSSHVKGLFRVDGLEYLEDALRRGKGVMGITGHYSHVIRGAFALGCLGYPMNIVMANLRDLPVRFLQQYLEKLLSRIQKRTGVAWMQRGGVISRTRDKLLNNEIVSYTADVPRSSTQDSGVRLQFLGGEIVFPTSLITLARETGASLIPALVFPQDGYPRYRIKIWPPLVSRREGTEGIIECLAQWVELYEPLIRRQPEYWLLWKDLQGFWRPSKTQGERTS